MCSGVWERRRSGRAAAQALLDMYTIKREIGRLENFSIGLVGDLANGVRSAASSPPQRQPPVDPTSGQAPSIMPHHLLVRSGLTGRCWLVSCGCGRGAAQRTVRSLAYLLSMYPGVKMYFVAPEVVRMKGDIKEYLTRCLPPPPPACSACGALGSGAACLELDSSTLCDGISSRWDVIYLLQDRKRTTPSRRTCVSHCVAGD